MISGQRQEPWLEINEEECTNHGKATSPGGKKTDKGVKVLHQIFRKHFYLSLVAAAVARAGAAVRAEAAEMLARAA